jgi:hypothetical protein
MTEALWKEYVLTVLGIRTLTTLELIQFTPVMVVV